MSSCEVKSLQIRRNSGVITARLKLYIGAAGMQHIAARNVRRLIGTGNTRELVNVEPSSKNESMNIKIDTNHTAGELEETDELSHSRFV